LTLTDPRGGQLFENSDRDPVGRPTGMADTYIASEKLITN